MIAETSVRKPKTKRKAASEVASPIPEPDKILENLKQEFNEAVSENLLARALISGDNRDKTQGNYDRYHRSMEVMNDADRRLKAYVPTSKTVPVAAAETTDPANINGDEDIFKFVDIEELHRSETAPQGERRKRFNAASLDELAESIKTKGIIEPLIVRTNFYGLEIVCGERRYLAAQRAGLDRLPVIVRDLSDDAALEIQLDENLHRQDVHPLDEAVWYEHLQNRLNLNLTGLSARVGKNERYVANRLKLNSLIEEAKNDLAADVLPLYHALEIAKFAPETQTAILAESYEKSYQDGDFQSDKSKPRSLKTFREKIKSDVLLVLKQAVFSTTATNLRPDQLPCTKCPQRTGARGLLFEDYYDRDSDRCLNRNCFENKTKNHVLLKRDELTREAIAAGGKSADYHAPLVTWQLFTRAAVVALYGETPLVDGDFEPIYNRANCDFTEKGIYANGGFNRTGEIVLLCRAPKCPKHKAAKKSASDAGSGEKTAQDKTEFYRRKQEIFDVRVGEAVRRNVLKDAASCFDAENTIFNRADADKYQLLLLKRLWHLQLSFNDHTAGIIAEILGLSKNGNNLNKWTAADKLQDLEKLSPEIRSQLLFLLLVAHEDELSPENSGSWRSQNKILSLADEFGVDYRLLDAAERVAQASAKHKDAAREHLAKVEAGDANAQKPVFWKAE